MVTLLVGALGRAESAETDDFDEHEDDVVTARDDIGCSDCCWDRIFW